jgi:hypothetical protein
MESVSLISFPVITRIEIGVILKPFGKLRINEAKNLRVGRGE